MNTTYKWKTEDLPVVWDTKLNKFYHDVNASLISSGANFFHPEDCKDKLMFCVLPIFCVTVYSELVYPVTMYIEYLNNFLSIARFAEYYSLSDLDAKLLLARGAVVNGLLSGDIETN